MDKENLLDKVNLIVMVDYGIGIFNLSIVINVEEFVFFVGECIIKWVCVGIYFFLNVINVIRVYNGFKKVG